MSPAVLRSVNTDLSIRLAGCTDLLAEVAALVREGYDIRAVVAELKSTPALPPFVPRATAGQQLGAWMGRPSKSVGAMEQMAIRGGPAYVMNEGRAAYKTEWNLAWLIERLVDQMLDHLRQWPSPAAEAMPEPAAEPEPEPAAPARRGRRREAVAAA